MLQARALRHSTDTSTQNRKADWVLFHEVVQTGDKTYIREITTIQKDWLLLYAPDYYRVQR